MRQRILVILGMSVALLALYTLVFTRQPSGRVATASMDAMADKTTAPVTAASVAPAGETTEKAADSSNVPVAVQPRLPESWGTDPFVRDWIMLNELANFSLKAITVGGDRAYVLINNQILEEGDEVSGKRIVSIESDKVTLEQGGRTFTLTLGE